MTTTDSTRRPLVGRPRTDAFVGRALGALSRDELFNGLSLEPVISDPKNPAASLLAGNGTFNVIGTNAGKKYLYYKTDYNNFAPSLGVAWSPRFNGGVGKFLFGSEGKSVIRGGYSQIYGNDTIITSLNNTLSGNVGLGRASSSAIGPTGSTALNDRLSGTNTPILPPAFVTPPRSFLQNYTLARVSLVSPTLSILCCKFRRLSNTVLAGNVSFSVTGSRDPVCRYPQQGPCPRC